MRCFPNGSLRAVTFSYDDANQADERLVALLNKYGLKGTFNVCTGFIRPGGRADAVPAARFPAVYRGHEVASHTVTHPNLVDIPAERARREVAEDKAFLSELMGYEVTGFAYPYGGFNEEIFQMLEEEGIRYGRTTEGTGAFALPTEPLRWKPTCHHNTLAECLNRFLATEPTTPQLLYVWGHSYEFDTEEKWAQMEALCARIAAIPHIWAATNRDVLDAVQHMAD